MDFITGEDAVNHRRLTIPAAVVGCLGIALAPALAEASTASATTSTHSAAAVTAGSAKTVSAAFAKAVGYKSFSSSASHSVRAKSKSSASSATSTGPNPDLADAIQGGDTSAYGLELDLTISGYTTTTTDGLSVTVDWGDGKTSTGTDTGVQPTYSHEYGALGTYTITVTVSDGEGDTVTNVISGAQTAGSQYTPYGPVRILDTRSGLGAAEAPVAADGTLPLQVTGAGTTGDKIPAGITAVVLNVTAVSPSAIGYLTVYGDEDSSGGALGNPGTSNINFVAGQTVPNLVVVPVGANGVVDIYNGSKGKTQVLADVAGYFTGANTDKYVAVSPARILDTRNGIGTGGKVAKIPAKGSVTLNIAGADDGALPASGISAVSLNLTAVDATSNGVITAYPSDQSLPVVSNLNYSPGHTIANMAIVPVDGTGQVTFYNNSSAPVDLLVDADGYYSGSTTAATASSYIVWPEPARILDTRQPEQILEGPVATGTKNAIPLAEYPYETSEVFNATVVQGTGTGYLSLYPYNPNDPGAVPGTSNLNYTAGHTVPNLAITSLGTVPDPNYSGAYDFGLYLGGSGTAQVILDWFGEFQDQ